MRTMVDGRGVNDHATGLQYFSELAENRLVLVYSVLALSHRSYTILSYIEIQRTIILSSGRMRIV